MKKLTLIVSLVGFMLILSTTQPLQTQDLNSNYLIAGSPPMVTVDQWSNTSQFFGTEMELIEGIWSPPEVYRLWTLPSDPNTLLVPPILNQCISSFDVNVTVDRPSEIVIALFSYEYPADRGFIGEELEMSGYETNGIVLAWSNRSDVSWLNATVEFNDWSYTGWYKLDITVVWMEYATPEPIPIHEHYSMVFFMGPDTATDFELPEVSTPVVSGGGPYNTTDITNTELPLYGLNNKTMEIVFITIGALIIVCAILSIVVFSGVKTKW